MEIIQTEEQESCDRSGSTEGCKQSWYNQSKGIDLMDWICFLILTVILNQPTL